MSIPEILLVTLNWAAHLSGYDMQSVPDVRFVSHQFLVTHACKGNPCNVVGWYNDQEVVYIDEVYRDRLSDNFPSSLLVHEFTHYLQHKSGYWHQTPMTCEKRIQREREAYAIQNAYVVRVLSTTDRIAPSPVYC